MSTANIPAQNTQEWLDLRKNYLGASDAPIIMEVSKWMSPLMLWKEKLGLGPEKEENYAMKYGKKMEPIALKAYENMVGESFSPVLKFHEEIEYMMASLDGMNSEHTRAVEIKNAGEEDHSLAKKGKIPDHYYPQLQHQLAVTGLEEMDYFSFNKGEGIIVKVKKDEKYLLKLYEKEEKFWNCIKTLQEPSLTSKDYIQRDNEWIEVAKKLHEIKEYVKNLKKEEKEMEAVLKKLSQERSSIGGGFKYTFYQSTGRISYSEIPELKNVDLEKYRGKPISMWKLTKEKK